MPFNQLNYIFMNNLHRSMIAFILCKLQNLLKIPKILYLPVILQLKH